jgi:hypothetical protein
LPARAFWELVAFVFFTALFVSLAVYYADSIGPCEDVTLTYAKAMGVVNTVPRPTSPPAN